MKKLLIQSLAFMFFYINVSIFVGNYIADFISITWLSNTLITLFPIILGIFFLWLFDKIAYDYINYSGIAKPFGAFFLISWLICYLPGNYQIIEYVNFTFGEKGIDISLNEKDLEKYSFVSFKSGYINNNYTYVDTTRKDYGDNNYDFYYDFKFITPVVPENWDESMPIRVFIASQGKKDESPPYFTEIDEYLYLGEKISDKIYLQGKVIKNKSVYAKFINSNDKFLGLKYDPDYIIYENVQDLSEYSSNLSFIFWVEILIINFVFLFFTYLSVNKKNNKYSFVRHLSKIKKYIKNNNFAKAQEFTFYLIRKHPNIPHFYYYYALSFYNQNKYNDAITYLEKCKEKSENYNTEKNTEKIEPFDDLLYYKLIIDSYIELKRYDKAVFYCNSGLKQFSNNDDLFQLKAYALLLDKKYEESIDAYDYYFKRYPEDRVIYLSYKIEALLELSEYDKVISELKSIIEEEVDSDLYLLRAKAYIGLNQTKKAKQDLQKAKKIDPYDPEIDEIIQSMIKY